MSVRHIDVLCICCDEYGRHNGRRLIVSCYMRHQAAGTLDQWPPVGTWLPRQWRMEDYGRLRARKLTHREIAEQLGVTERTVERYAAAHRHLTKTRTEAAA